jgi:hypothetical protein
VRGGRAFIIVGDIYGGVTGRREEAGGQEVIWGDVVALN